MSFTSFAASYGLIIDNPVVGKWVRCSTTDHPRKKNGSYIFNGTDGAVKNWAIHEKAIYWRDKHATPIDDREYRRNLEKSKAELREKQSKAAKKAGWIMHNATKGHHDYLAAKGFTDEKGYIWDGKLVIPMRINGELVGCQLIDRDGNKKFLYGQKTKGATAGFDAKGRTILTEGYATALSVRRALKAAKQRYNILVCFSAGNMENVAMSHADAFLIADKDKSGTGQRVAEKTKRPYWISPVMGEDFNDYQARVGVDESSLILSAMIR